MYLYLHLYAFFARFFPTFTENLLDLGPTKKKSTIFSEITHEQKTLGQASRCQQYTEHVRACFRQSQRFLPQMRRYWLRQCVVVLKAIPKAWQRCETRHTLHTTANVGQHDCTWSCSKGKFLLRTCNILVQLRASKQRALWNLHLAMSKNLTLKCPFTFQSVQSHMHASDGWELIADEKPGHMHALKQNKLGSVYHSYPISCCMWDFGLTLNSFHR